MKYTHFVIFAAEMINESAHILADENMQEDHLSEAGVIQDIAEYMVQATLNKNDEVELDSIAEQIGMYEFIEGWADEGNEEHSLHKLALQYVIPC